MKDIFHTHLKKAGEGISLTPEERERMRGAVYSYMAMKPLRGPASPEPRGSFGWIFSPRPVAAVLVLGFFISSGGISYAAEGAVPGDLLYPIKTEVNEPLKGALALTSSAKAAWAIEVASTRVSEATSLAAEGRLSTTTQQRLQASFQKHAALATERLGEEASSSPEASAETATRFEAQLSEYEAVLEKVGRAKGVDVAELLASVHSESKQVARVRATAESRITPARDYDGAANRMRRAARNQLDTSIELARTVSQSLSSSSAQTVSTSLDDAEAKISEGEDLSEKKDNPEAREAYQDALTAAEKLGVYLKTRADIRARTGRSVDDLDRDDNTSKNIRGRDDSDLEDDDELLIKVIGR